MMNIATKMELRLINRKNDFGGLSSNCKIFYRFTVNSGTIRIGGCSADGERDFKQANSTWMNETVEAC